MKKIAFLLMISVAFFACKEKRNYASFGEKIDDSGAISVSELSKEYAKLSEGDTLTVKFEGNINEVCKKKGCWMTVTLEDGQDAFIRFKDYGFFVPLNADSSYTVVSGKAFVNEVSVEELRHFAQDAGRSEEEIANITSPKREFAFTADGVLIEEKELVD